MGLDGQFGSKEIKRVKEFLELGDLKVFMTKEPMPKYIKLEESGTHMALKTRPVILRIHASKKKEYLEGIYSELLLYLPWRNESELEEGNGQECVNLFNTNATIIEKNKTSIFPNAKMIDAMMELLDSPEGTWPIHLGDNIDPNAQQENEDDEVELQQTNPLDTSELPPEADSKRDKKKPDGSPYKPIPMCTQDEMMQKARSLSYNQRIVFDKIVTFSKSVIRAEKGNDPMSILPPPLLMVHGGEWSWEELSD